MKKLPIRRLLMIAIVATLVMALLLVGAYFAPTFKPFRHAVWGSDLLARVMMFRSEVMGLKRQPTQCNNFHVGPDGVNVIVIAVDTLRADHLGFHGYPRAVSPNLDALSGDSLAFQQATASAPWTLPSFAGVFTGIHPAALGLTKAPRPIPAEVSTLAEQLCGRGYRTAGVSSHLQVGIEFGFDRGFEMWDQSNAAGHTHVSSPDVTGIASRYVEKLARTNRPFFLFVHYFDPHYDYREHAGFAFGNSKKAGIVRNEHDNIWKLRDLSERGLLSEETLLRLVDDYDSEIAFTDHYIGQFIDRLREEGLYDKSLIIFVADHGEMFGDRKDGWIGHSRYLYGELINVPLLIKLPGQVRTGVVEQHVSTVDLYATILGIVDKTTNPEGRSLLAADMPASPVFSQTRYDSARDSIIAGRWKLIRDQETASDQLFDIAADPREQTDLADDYPDRVLQLSGLLAEWLQEQEQLSSQFEETPEKKLSEADIEKLKSLGYIQ